MRHFVGEFRNHRAVAGWDLGNKCNCMGTATREQAYVWTATISNAIRSADPTRPVVSGMHSLSPQGTWTMQDPLRADRPVDNPPVSDLHCARLTRKDVNTIRTILHSTAESRFYADLGGKPCLRPGNRNTWSGDCERGHRSRFRTILPFLPVGE